MKTVSNSRIFVDTNILYYANYPADPFGPTCANRLSELAADNNKLVISAQIIREYTHATLRNELYHKRDLFTTLATILRNINRFQLDFEVVPETPDALQNWLAFLPGLTTHKDVFDFNIAATLQAHDIRYILTHNASDFNRFSDWLTVVPLFPQP